MHEIEITNVVHAADIIEANNEINKLKRELCKLQNVLQKPSIDEYSYNKKDDRIKELEEKLKLLQIRKYLKKLKKL